MKISGGCLNNSNGVALVIVIIVITILTLIGSFMANLSYNQRRLVDMSSGRRAVLYYRAQAGVVDAQSRIRVNLGGQYPSGGPAVNYQLNLDGSGPDEVDVTVGADIAGVRTISAEGLNT